MLWDRMRSNLHLLIALALTTVASTHGVAAPLEAYGRLPNIETAALSGDGSLVAVASAVGDKRVLAIRKVGETKNSLAILVGASKIRDLRWVGSSHLLVTISLTTAVFDVINPRDEWYEVIDLNLKARTQMNVLGGARDSIRAAIGAPSIRILGGQPYAFVQAYHFVDDVGRDAVYRINLDTAQINLIAVGKPETDAWLIDRDGQPVAESRYDSATSKYSLRVRRGDDWRVIDEASSAYGDSAVLGLGRDGRSVVSSDFAGGHVVLHELAPGAQAWGDAFGTGDQDLIYDTADERLIGSHGLVGDTDQYTFYAPADQAAWDSAAGSFPNARVTLRGFSADHGKLLVMVDSPSEGVSYAVVDATAHTTQPIGPAYAALTPDDISTVQPVSFKANDGRALTGYLTLPKGREPKGLPLVVFPHGGPAARDEPGFDWWAQAMASRGYAVLQVNYRGSDGFGGDFLEAGFGQWGRKMETDLSDGVRYLAAHETVDPKRVCIVGASYGGYAALAGPTLDPGVYRCAVSIAGISDLSRFVQWSRTQSNVAVQRYWTRYLGASGPKDPILGALSPVSLAATVTAPILLIHGNDDTVVPFEQSQIMADALKKAGKPYDFVVLNHEDHWLSHGDTRLQMLQATMDFLAKNNPAD